MVVLQVETKVEFDQILSSGDKLVVVYFTAQWCGPCQRIKPVFDSLSEEITDVVFIRVDIDENTVRPFKLLALTLDTSY